MSIDTIERRPMGKLFPSDHAIDAGRRLKALRHKNDLSQEALARKLGISFQAYQKYEKGTSQLSVERIRQICGVLHMSISYFLGKLSDGDSLFVDIAQDRGAVALMEAFSAITDPRDRNIVLAMAESLAEKSAK